SRARRRPHSDDVQRRQGFDFGGRRRRLRLMSALKCTITMDKTQGVVIEVVDADAQAKQTISLLKDSIVLTVVGTAATSVVTQKADSVSIKCKSFSVEADEVSCK